jgi:hypothetical protein
MKIPFIQDNFPDAKPGDTLDLIATGVVSDDGKTIIVTTVEDEEVKDEGEDDDDDEDEGKETETEETETETETESMAPVDLSAAMNQFASQV